VLLGELFVLCVVLTGNQLELLLDQICLLVAVVVLSLLVIEEFFVGFGLCSTRVSQTKEGDHFASHQLVQSFSSHFDFLTSVRDNSINFVLQLFQLCFKVGGGDSFRFFCGNLIHFLVVAI